MSRTIHLALAAVTAFFLLFPLTLGKPGLPTHLKADEAAYYLAAQSLAYDRDLRVEPQDVDRAFQEFPFGPVNNMIVMSDDGWHTVYFAKPYIYSLAGAPFARLFGANGMLFFNMLMTMAMVWMGYLYLRRYNPPGLAALFSASFFLLSVGFSYVFWIQPEVFNMFSVAACLFFGLPRIDETGLPDRRRELLFALLSGARPGARRLRQADVRRRGARAALRLLAGTAAGRRSASGCWAPCSAWGPSRESPSS